MEIEWNMDQFGDFAKRIEEATNEAFDAVAAQHAGDPVDTVRAALTAELAKRFEPGTGPDDILIGQMAEQISAG